MGSIPQIQLNQNKPSSIVDPVRLRRSVFDLSQAHLTTVEADIVYPIFWEEVIPSDTFKINTKIAGRLATPLFPLMDNLWCQYDWWFVPHRIVWNHFVNFWGERSYDSGTGTNKQTEYLVPIIDDTSKEYSAAAATIASQGFKATGLFDYLLAGQELTTPRQTSLGNYVTALLPRSYMAIGYHWYIDQRYGTIFINAAGNVEVAGFIGMNTGDGPDNCSTFQLFKKGKKKDYFTQLQPVVMNGTNAAYVTNVLGAFVPITHATEGTLTDDIIRKSSAPNNWKAYNVSTNTTTNGPGNIGVDAAGGDVYNTAAPNPYLSLDPNGGLQLDLTNIGVSINNIRLYEQIQKYYERAARVGTRYVEYAFATYGVNPEDSRLQLPEWLGGNTERLNMTPVASTADSGSLTPGDLAAFGTLVSYSRTITKSFSEHGFVMCLASIFPDLTYQRGIDRKLLRRSTLDYHDPLWENLTEQIVTKRELTVANDATDAQTLGYSPRFAEMKSGRRKLSGLMRSNHAQTLDAWHLSQEVPTGQSMDGTFRTYDTDMSRVQAVGSQPALILYAEAEITAARPLQVNPVPMLGGQF